MTAAFEILKRRALGRVEQDAPLASLTSYQIGGPAAVYLEAEGEGDLDVLAEAVRETGLPVLMVGRGSNLLISDRGFGGIAVRLGSGFRWSRVEYPKILAGAGVPLPSLAMLAADHALSGFEFAVAIPASLGGAVRMNAGAHGHETGEVLESVQGVVLPAGERISIDDITYTYRRMHLPDELVVTAATLALSPGDPEEVHRKTKEAREWRREHQPLNLPNAGSVFKNPPGDAAGRLIEEVCGRLRLGAARVSEVHANFIVAERGARADDVYTLIRIIQRRVAAATGIELETEVRLVGEFEEVLDEPTAG
ncbi:MAG: UDP-N-acetylmuramate dehydrogenase [Actinomycetota bacterium]|nr:UDP-N-acetylmuramate dehydrogenase [Actinomycetota bacterium]